MHNPSQDLFGVSRVLCTKSANQEEIIGHTGKSYQFIHLAMKNAEVINSADHILKNLTEHAALLWCSIDKEANSMRNMRLRYVTHSSDKDEMMRIKWDILSHLSSRESL